MSQKELMEAISRQVLRQAEEIRNEAVQRAADIVKKAEGELDRIGAEVIEKAKASVRSEESRIVNEARLKAKRDHLAAKHRLVEQVMESFRDHLAALPRHKDYRQVLQRLLDEALQGVTGPVIVRCLPADAPLVKEHAARHGVKATIEEKPFPLGGVEVLWGEGFRLHARNTLQSRMEKINMEVIQEANRRIFGSPGA